MPFWQRLIWPAGGCAFLVLLAWQYLNKDYKSSIAWAVMILTVSVLLTRALLYMDSTAFEDPNRTIFFGIFAFIPIVYISAFIALKPQSAVFACVTTWLLFATTTSIWLIPAAQIGRQGADHALMVLFIGQPLAIILLSALPGYHRITAGSQAEKEDIQNQVNRLTQQAITDHLTELLNRRGFDDQMSSLWTHTDPLKPWALLIYADVDYFKKYNDALGHSAGDLCLQELGKVFKKLAEDNQLFAARMGGEELTLFGTCSTAAEAYSLALQLEKSVNKLAIPHPASEDGSHLVRMSYGASIVKTNSISRREFIKSADEAMYQAKNQGRSRLCFSPQALSAISST